MKLSLGVIFFFSIVLELFAPNSVSAEFEPARLINESCEEAKLEFSKLALPERQQLAEYAALVVKLPAPSAPVIDLSPNSNNFPLPSKEMSNVHIWSLFDPKRESAIRRCALWILEESRPASAVFLAELGELAESRSLLIIEAKLQYELIESAFLIAEDLRSSPAAVHSQAFVAETISKLLGELEQEKNLYPKALLIALGELSVKPILDSIKTDQTKALAQKFEILSAVDPDGALSGKALSNLFLTLLSQAEVDGTLPMLGQHLARVPLYHSVVLPKVIATISREERASLGYDFLSIAGSMEYDVALAMFKLPKDSVIQLVRELSKANQSQFRTLHNFLLKFKDIFPDLESQLVRSFADESIPPERLAKMIELSAALFPSGQRIFGALLNLLDNSNLVVRVAAAHSLGEFSSRSRESLSHLLKLLKRSSPPGALDFKDRLSISTTIADSLVKLNSGSGAQSAIQYLLDLRALAVEKEIAPSDLSKLEAAVISCGNLARPALYKRLGTDPLALKVPTLRMISELRPIEAANLDILLESFASSESGSTVELADILSELFKHLPNSLRSVPQKRLIKLVDGTDAARSTSAAILLLELGSKEKRLQDFGFWKDRVSSFTQREALTFLNQSEIIKVPEEVRLKIISTRFIDERSQKLSASILQLAAKVNEPNLAEPLRRALDKSDRKDPSRIQAMLLLSKLDPRTFDLTSTLMGELEVADQNLRTNYLAQIPAPHLLEVVTRLVRSKDRVKQTLGLSFIPGLAEFAAPLKGDILKLQADEEVVVRREAEHAAARVYRFSDKEFADETKLLVRAMIYKNTALERSDDYRDVLIDLLGSERNRYSSFVICSRLLRAERESLPLQCEPFRPWIDPITN